MNSCPYLEYNATQFTYDKVKNFSLEVNPNTYLGCGSLFFDVINATWKAINAQTNEVYQSLNTSNPNSLLSFIMLRSNQNVQRIPSGSVVTV